MSMFLLFSPDSAQLLVSSPYCHGTPLDVVSLLSARTAGWCLIKQVIERYREKKKDLHIIFIDLKKAYDKIPRNVMW